MTYKTLRMIDEIYTNIIKIKQDLLKIMVEMDDIREYIDEIGYMGDIESDTSSDSIFDD